MYLKWNCECETLIFVKLAWDDLGSKGAKPLSGNGHTNQVCGIAKAGSAMVSIGMDDTIRFIDTNVSSFQYYFQSW